MSKCGSTDTRTGQPCQFPSEENCPHHTGDGSGAGRPKLTLDDLPNEWEDLVYSMYQEGASDTEVMVALGLGSRHTFHRLMDDHDKFLHTIKRGRMLARAWWEEKGRTNLSARDFNHNLWKINMENRFKWSERKDHNLDANVNVEDASESLERFTKMFQEESDAD